MTNKINGIDISECKLYDYGICDSEMAENLNCEQNPDCYFKQLKRLQKENKRLQMLSCANCGEKYLSPDGAELYEKNVQLQKENEGLKKQLEFSRTHKTELDAERIKYKQALEKIRGILNKECGVISNAKAVGIINEVLNDRD